MEIIKTKNGIKLYGKVRFWLFKSTDLFDTFDYLGKIVYRKDVRAYYFEPATFLVYISKKTLTKANNIIKDLEKKHPELVD